jgi:hypothetical protein
LSEVTIEKQKINVLKPSSSAKKEKKNYRLKCEKECNDLFLRLPLFRGDITEILLKQELGISNLGSIDHQLVLTINVS